MRRPDLTPDTYHHVILRGARGMSFLHDKQDWWECLKLLYYHNDTFQYGQWRRDVAHMKTKELFSRPATWPKRDPLISLLAFCIHGNHVHLLVKEIREGGLSWFMHRFPNSMTLRYNKKYGGSGSIFQGSYASRLIRSDNDLQIVALYIMAKNVFERYPKSGLKKATDHFEDAYQWALTDSFSSFADYAAERNSPIIEKDLLGEFFPTPSLFKKEAKEYLEWYRERQEEEREDFFE